MNLHNQNLESYTSNSNFSKSASIPVGSNASIEHEDRNRNKRQSNIPFVSPQYNLNTDIASCSFGAIQTEPNANPIIANESTCTTTSCISNDFDSEVPYICIDGRRKRRRTTLEDAFNQCLSMNMEDENNCIGDNEITTPTKDSLSKDDSMHGSGLDWDASSPDARGHGRSNSGDQGVISKRLDYYGESYANGNGNCTPMPRESYSRTSSMETINDRDDGEESISSVSDSEGGNTTSYSSSLSSSSLSSGSGAVPACYAPRKAKKQMEYLDPVDERIEDLIRHSRIKAMVLTNREVERQKQRQKAYQKFKTQQMDEKDSDYGRDRHVMNDDVNANVGNGSPENMPNDLRRKNEKEKGLFTGKSTDDFEHRLGVGHGRRTMPFARGRSSFKMPHGSGPLLDDGPLHQTRSSSIPRDMKYCESSMDVEMTEQMCKTRGDGSNAHMPGHS